MKIVGPGRRAPSPFALTVAEWQLLKPGDRVVAMYVTGDTPLGYEHRVVSTHLAGNECMIVTDVGMGDGWYAGRFRLPDHRASDTSIVQDILAVCE